MRASVIVAGAALIAALRFGNWRADRLFHLDRRSAAHRHDRRRRLHLTGSYYIWLIFMNSYLGRIARETPPEPRIIFIATATLRFAALGLRFAASVKRRRKSAPATA